MSFFKKIFDPKSDYWQSTRIEDYIKRAKNFLENVQFDDAIAELKKGLEKHTNDPELLIMLAKIYYGLEKYDDAVTQLSTIPDKLTCKIKLYEHYLNLNQFETANDQLVKDIDIDIDPKYIHELLKLGKNYTAGNKENIKRKLVCIKTAMKIYIGLCLAGKGSVLLSEYEKICFKDHGEKICKALINFGNSRSADKDDKQDNESVITECFKYASQLLRDNPSKIFLPICNYYLSLAENFKKEDKLDQAKKCLDTARKTCMLQPSSKERKNMLRDIAKSFNQLAKKFKEIENHKKIVECLKSIMIMSCNAIIPGFEWSSDFQETIQQNLFTWAKKIDETSNEPKNSKAETDAENFYNQLNKGTFSENLKTIFLSKIEITEDENDNDAPIAPPPPGFREFKIKTKDGKIKTKRMSVLQPFEGNIIDGRGKSTVSMNNLMKEMQESKNMTPDERKQEARYSRRYNRKFLKNINPPPPIPSQKKPKQKDDSAKIPEFKENISKEKNTNVIESRKKVPPPPIPEKKSRTQKNQTNPVAKKEKNHGVLLNNRKPPPRPKSKHIPKKELLERLKKFTPKTPSMNNSTNGN